MQNTNVKNTADQGAKLVFKNAEMCAQFLEDYIPIPCLKGLKPEQIEDMSARFTTMWDNERDSDVVKRIHLSRGIQSPTEIKPPADRRRGQWKNASHSTTPRQERQRRS